VYDFRVRKNPDYPTNSYKEYVSNNRKNPNYNSLNEKFNLVIREPVNKQKAIIARLNDKNYIIEINIKDVPPHHINHKQQL